jgi:serine/threonine protein kinase
MLYSGCDYSELSCLHDTKRTVVTKGNMMNGIVVLKRFKIVDENSISRFENELKLLTLLSFNSEHVLRPLGSIREAPLYGIIQPYCELGSLGKLLHDAKYISCGETGIHETLMLSAAARVCAARDLLCAVSHCHNEKVIVRDIKPENILVVRTRAFSKRSLEWSLNVDDFDRAWISSAN